MYVFVDDLYFLQWVLIVFAIANTTRTPYIVCVCKQILVPLAVLLYKTFDMVSYVSGLGGQFFYAIVLAVA